MSKGKGQKIAIKFDKALLGEVAGNESAFTVTGLQRDPLGVGELTEKQYAVSKVERYPVATLYEDDFTDGTGDGVEVGGNGLVLESGEGIEVEDFETANSLTLGGMPVARQAGSAKNGSYGLKGTPATTPSQKVVDAILSRGADFKLSGWVRTDTDHSVTGLTGLCFGAPAGYGTSGYQVLIDVRNGTGATSALQIRKDYATTGLLASSQTPIISINAWYFIEITWSSVGLITANLYNESLTLLGTLIATDNTYTSGKYGVCCYSNSSFDDIGTGVSQYDELGTHTPPPIPTTTLPESPRIRFEADTPPGTSITIEYATNNSDTTPPETWTAAEESDLLTIDGDFLWLRYTLETQDTAVTPTLLAVWIEEAESPPDTILLTMTEAGLFRDVEGDLTVAYDQTLGNLAGTRPVENFEVSFSPTNLESTPQDIHTITATGTGLAVHLLPYNAPPDPDYEGGESPPHTITATGTGVSVDFIHIDYVDP